MKYSVRKQMTVVFIGLFVFILGAVLIINTGFLGSYYLSHKSKDLIRTYNEIDRLIQEDGLTDEEAMEGILLRTERSNTDLVVVNTSGNAILSTLSRDDPRFKEMMIRGLLGLSVISPEKVISENDNYTIYWTDNQGDSGNVEYLKMWGRFSDGSWFVMQSPLASIRESASLANRFLIYLGGLGIILGGVLVWLFSRRFTRSVMELARLSQEMANLNFDAKY